MFYDERLLTIFHELYAQYQKQWVIENNIKIGNVVSIDINKYPPYKICSGADWSIKISFILDYHISENLNRFKILEITNNFGIFCENIDNHNRIYVPFYLLQLIPSNTDTDFYEKQLVLYRDNNGDAWSIGVFCSMSEVDDFPYKIYVDKNNKTINFRQCIPYKGNEYLLYR